MAEQMKPWRYGAVIVLGLIAIFLITVWLAVHPDRVGW